MTAPRFYGDWATEVTYPAIAYESDWNGWAAPIVDRVTLDAVIADSPGYELRSRLDASGEFVTTVWTNHETDGGVWESYAVLRFVQGGYALRDLGWTFSTVDDAVTDDDRDEFIAGFCEAVLWANTRNADEPDDDSHQLTDWHAPVSDWQLRAFDPASQTRIAEICDAFLTAAAPLLRAATVADPRRTMAFHGHDFALTAEHHGTGFWDRGYPDDVSDALTTQAQAYSADAWFSADGIVRFEG